MIFVRIWQQMHTFAGRRRCVCGFVYRRKSKQVKPALVYLKSDSHSTEKMVSLNNLSHPHLYLFSLQCTSTSDNTVSRLTLLLLWQNVPKWTIVCDPIFIVKRCEKYGNMRRIQRKAKELCCWLAFWKANDKEQIDQRIRENRRLSTGETAPKRASINHGMKRHKSGLRPNLKYSILIYSGNL